MESYSDAKEKTFYEPVQNPLWLDLILDRVFSFLPKSALANCRMVCRQWFEVSERHFVSRNQQSPTTVDLRSTDRLLSFLSTFVQRRDFDSNLLGCPNSSLWSSYKLQFEKMRPLQQQPQLDKISPFQQQLFMNICGDSMKRVSIDKFNNLEIVSALSMFLNWTPQLESLELSGKVSNNVVDLENQEETNKNSKRPFFTHLHSFRILSLYFIDIAQEDIEPHFSGLFQLMPHLQDFRILKVVLNSGIRRDLITSCIIQALQVPVQVTVKEFEKGQVMENSPSFLGQLVSLKLPHLTDQHLHDLHQFSLYNSLRLEKFWLVNFWDCADRSNLLTFLQGQAESLQKVCLAPFAAILFLHLPLNFTLDHVSTLNIFRCKQTLDECYLFVPHILGHFPNLKKLTIYRPHYDRSNNCTTVMSIHLMKKLAVEQSKLRIANMSMSSNMVTCDRLTTVQFSGSSSYEEDDEFLTWLTKFCPNVTDLELRFSCREGTLPLRPVFDGWRKLRRLVIYFFGWKNPLAMESYFTGSEHQPSTSFCISVMKNFQGHDWYIVHEYEDKSRDRETGEKFPSLLHLQDLRTLKIYMTGETVIKPQVRVVNGVPDRWFLSDRTVLTTIIRMSRLRELFVSHSSISPSVLRTLKEALDLEKCLVGDKVGQLIQFQVDVKVKDQAFDYGKGQVDFIDHSSGGQQSANAKPCQSVERPSTLHQYGAFNLLLGPESCCPIV